MGKWIYGAYAAHRNSDCSLPFFQNFLSFMQSGESESVYIYICMCMLLLDIHPFPLHNYCQDYATHRVIYGTDLGGKLFNGLKFIDGIMNAEIYSGGFLKRDERKKIFLLVVCVVNKLYISR